MSKTATKPADFIENVEFPTFDASKATDQFRAFTEKGVEQTKEVYSKLKTGAEFTQKAVETTVETAKTPAASCRSRRSPRCAPMPSSASRISKRWLASSRFPS